MKIAVAGATGAVGHHVVEIARTRGHEVVLLSRSTGIDLTARTADAAAAAAGAAAAPGAAASLAAALVGVDAVVDVASVSTQSATASRAFFGAVTAHLLAAEETAGVAHHIALSIVGSDRAPYGYYAGKALQERLVAAGRIPWTILRATQFHEFAQQIHGQYALGPISLVPTMVSQPVAAREVAGRLVELAEAAPVGHATDLAGPERLRMAEMVRAYSAAIGAKGPIVEIPLPGGFGRALRDGTILPDPAAAAADHGTQTFAEWIAALPPR